MLSMNVRVMRLLCAVGLALFYLGSAGCSQSGSKQEGIQVMFENNPRVYKNQVYYFGQVIGQVVDQKPGNGSVFMVVIRLASAYAKDVGHHWVFYVDNGCLNAAMLNASGAPLEAGGRLCGFDSKAALNWFKFKTLLTDRVYKATQKAESLSRRFG
jgi:hypothetical protein